MFFKILVVALSFVGAVTPYPSVKRDSDTDDIKIYAYGSGISGLQVYGGPDGMSIAENPQFQSLSAPDLF